MLVARPARARDGSHRHLEAAPVESPRAAIEDLHRAGLGKRQIPGGDGLPAALTDGRRLELAVVMAADPRLVPPGCEDDGSPAAFPAGHVGFRLGGGLVANEGSKRLLRDARL